jgi:hypothetical protein
LIPSCPTEYPPISRLRLLFPASNFQAFFNKKLEHWAVTLKL